MTQTLQNAAHGQKWCTKWWQFDLTLPSKSAKTAGFLWSCHPQNANSTSARLAEMIKNEDFPGGILGPPCTTPIATGVGKIGQDHYKPCPVARLVYIFVYFARGGSAGAAVIAADWTTDVRKSIFATRLFRFGNRKKPLGGREKTPRKSPKMRCAGGLVHFFRTPDVRKSRRACQNVA